MNAKQKAEIELRSGGLCEVHGENCRPDFRGLQHAHITHKMMGGRNGDMKEAIDDPRNQVKLCAYLHDVLDNRVKAPKLREWLTKFVKEKTQWESWAKEHGIAE